jgi:hypothetical protein
MSMRSRILVSADLVRANHRRRVNSNFEWVGFLNTENAGALIEALRAGAPAFPAMSRALISDWPTTITD